ncbi:MAG TPA: mannosyltransferase family protein [Streptosporangiaceae bacterium]|nr:mannosyltransferase family protein [Streptosporangiaceae bacterium]
MSATVAAERGTDPPARPEGWREGLRQWLPAMRYCTVVYLAVRIALFLLAAAAWGLTTEHPSSMPNGQPLPLTNGWQNAFTDWDKLDANWFLYIAQAGYSDHNDTAAFFPGYPMLVRLVRDLCFGNLLLAAYLVTNLCLLVALILLYRLTEREYDQATAGRAVLYLAIFPTAVFLFGLYSESVFLVAAVGAFYLARRGHWWWAGVVGIGATLTRSVGVIIALALAVEAVQQTVENYRRQSPRTTSRLRFTATLVGRLAASAVPLAGTAAYLLFWQLRYHDWTRPITIQKKWQRVLTPPWQTLWHGLTLAVSHAPLGGNARPTYDFVLVAVGLALGIWVAVRTRPAYAVYTWGSILLFLSESATKRPLDSDPRFLVTIFPLVWTLARLGRRPGWHEGIVAVSAASLAIISWLFLTTRLVF